MARLDKIAEATLSPSEVLDYAVQIADGLDAAHRKGIGHRDIKLANIFITTRNQAKILDFGLAELIVTAESGASAVEDTKHVSGAAGTAAYMSPEQVLREPLDARSDLFSFGVVLYEMSTGRRPFEGETNAAIFDAILHRTPSPADLEPALPSALDRIITKCLLKDRDLRYQRASEISSDLQRVRYPESPVEVSSMAATHWIRILTVALAVAGLIVAVYLFLRRAPKLTDRDTIVLADFVNQTGDPVFDGTLRQALAVELGQSPFLSIVPEDASKLSFA